MEYHTQTMAIYSSDTFCIYKCSWMISYFFWFFLISWSHTNFHSVSFQIIMQQSPNTTIFLYWIVISSKADWGWPGIGDYFYWCQTIFEIPILILYNSIGWYIGSICCCHLKNCLWYVAFQKRSPNYCSAFHWPSWSDFTAHLKT